MPHIHFTIQKKYLLLTWLLWITISFDSVAAQQPDDPVKFAFVSDTHIGSGNASQDLKRTVADINSQSDVNFVVITGDITEFGSNGELDSAKVILDKLNKPWHIIPGNHDTKWSESGANYFRQVFGSDRISFTYGGYTFLGCSSGPNMRMAPGLVPREDLVWLDSIVDEMKGSTQPVIFLNHYPLDEGLANWFQVIDLLKQVNIQAALCGHGHRNRAMNVEGIPAVMSRSNLRARDTIGGYNLVTIHQDTMTFSVRYPGVRTEDPWHQVVLKDHHFQQDSVKYPRPSYQVNEQYPAVEVAWEIQDDSDIGTGIVVQDSLAVYSNTNGEVVALQVSSGKILWKYQTKGKIYSTPAIASGKVVTASTDGSIYCLQLTDGALLWKTETQRGIVASPTITDDVVYIGSSEGKFRAVSLTNGRILWEFQEVKGFVETQPLVDEDRVYFGDWGGQFYALDRKTGKSDWLWHGPNEGRMYSPAACFPVKAHGKIFIVAPDRYITALDAQTGAEVWRSEKDKGREAMGLSGDGSQLYVKSMQDTLWAIDTEGQQFQPDWSLNCGYGYDISPSPIIEDHGMIYVPTDKGVIYAIDKEKHQIVWAHKLSNALINNICPLEKNVILTTTMDGKVSRLKYK